MHDDAHYDDDHANGHDEPSTIKEVVITIVAALLLAYVVQGYLVKPYRIPSGSMENTLRCGDRVLVNRLGYHFGDPHRKDVVVFHPPAGLDEKGNPDPSTVAGEGGEIPKGKLSKADVNYIKRVIGMPGDTVQVKAHHAYINGKELDEPYLHPLPKSSLAIGGDGDFGPITLKKHQYFMMGDHRDNSADSRVFGPVPRDFVIGKAFMVYWPPSRFGGLPDKDPGGPKASAPDPKCIESAPSVGDNG